MASVIDSIDRIIEGLVISESFPQYGSVIFFLLFFVIFSISFASTAFIPVFKGEDKMNNVRAVISFSIAFLASVFYFDWLKSSLLFFGVWMVTSFLASFAVIAVVPKEQREKASKSIIPICLFLCFILTLILFFGYMGRLFSFLDPLVGFFANF
ncbi:MAG: hypothetical protein PHG04_03520 [Candidatus Nanoarchaeia archaeon]|nr:hypothetical protein [Candidatus Nanoarchaeia archaeon]MDD5054418.1 hypothetical protein [Candidatus Nanoarchaeia archaeon]